MSDALRPAGDKWALRFERRLAHPPKKVWRAITEPANLSEWYPLTVTELDPRIGGAILFRDEEGTELRGEITEFEPLKAFAFQEFGEQDRVDDLQLELRPDADGCLLIFTHTFADKTEAAGTETGWKPLSRRARPGARRTRVRHTQRLASHSTVLASRCLSQVGGPGGQGCEPPGR